MHSCSFIPIPLHAASISASPNSIPTPLHVVVVSWVPYWSMAAALPFLALVNATTTCVRACRSGAYIYIYIYIICINMDEGVFSQRRAHVHIFLLDGGVFMKSVSVEFTILWMGMCLCSKQ